MLNTFSLRIDPIYSISNISAILGACLSWGILEQNAMNAAKAWMEAGLSCQIDMVVYSCWTSVRAMVEIIWESIKPFTFLPTLLPSLFHTGLWSEEALAECNAFSSRIPNDKQAPKMAGMWLIEWVRSIHKDNVKNKEPSNKAQLKKVILQVCKEIVQDKVGCRRLISSIPDILSAVIRVGGK